MKDVTLQGHSLCSLQHKRFASKNNLVHQRRQQNQPVEPSYHNIASHPGPQKGFNHWEEPPDFHGFCSKPWKRIILDHVKSQAAQAARCLAHLVLGRNGLPHGCNVVFDGAWKHFFCHVGKTAAQKAAVSAKAFSMHPVRTKKRKTGTRNQSRLANWMSSRVLSKEGLKGSGGSKRNRGHHLPFEVFMWFLWNAGLFSPFFVGPTDFIVPNP